MGRGFRFAVVTLACLALGGTAAVAGLLYRADRKAQRHIAIPAHALRLPSAEANLEHGRYLFGSRGCAECHGADGAGRVFIDDGKGMRVKAPNISSSPSSVVAAYDTVDWERAIRHGVKPNGTPLLLMPSEDYSRLTDDDLADLVAYARQLPPVSGTPALIQLPLPVRVLYAVGVVQDAAEKIDHHLPAAAPVPAAVTPAHGAYVADMCTGCHGAGLSGGAIPGGPPAWPAAANLTPGQGSAMTRYPSVEQFAAMLRTGRRPDGTVINAAMPFESLRRLDDTDVQALYLYLRSLPPRPYGQR